MSGSETFDDHYANIEASYFVQKLGEYDRITILATKLQHKIDDTITLSLYGGCGYSTACCSAIGQTQDTSPDTLTSSVASNSKIRGNN